MALLVQYQNIVRFVGLRNQHIYPKARCSGVSLGFAGVLVSVGLCFLCPRQGSLAEWGWWGGGGVGGGQS